MIVYSDLVAAVLTELGADGTRRGIEQQRAKWIRDALIDLQRYIRPFRQGHVTRYTADDQDLIGYAGLFQLPDQAKPKAFYIACAPGAQVVEPSASIQSWADLAAIKTLGLPVPQIRIWVDADTGLFKVTQLRESTDETDVSSGIQRPDDYANPGNTKVWFQAS